MQKKGAPGRARILWPRVWFPPPDIPVAIGKLEWEWCLVNQYSWYDLLNGWSGTVIATVGKKVAQSTRS